VTPRTLLWRRTSLRLGHPLSSPCSVRLWLGFISQPLVWPVHIFPFIFRVGPMVVVCSSCVLVSAAAGLGQERVLYTRRLSSRLSSLLHRPYYYVASSLHTMHSCITTRQKSPSSRQLHPTPRCIPGSIRTVDTNSHDFCSCTTHPSPPRTFY